MPVALLYPGVYIEEVSSGVRTITGVATSIAVFVGWAPRGSVERATRVASFPDYERACGGLDVRSNLGYAVKHFFDNGGTDAYIVRITHSTATTAACAIGPLTIEASSPGKWANTLQVRLTRRPAPDDARFRLDVIDPANGNAVLESFADLSMTPADPRFVETVVNGRSAFIDNLDATTTATPANATVAIGATTAGDDGTVIGPGDNVFITALTARFATGGIADRIDLFNLICVPGLTDTTTIGGLQTVARRRRAFLIVDCGENDTVATAPNSLANLTGNDAPNSAFYFPLGSRPRPEEGRSDPRLPAVGLRRRDHGPDRRAARRLESSGRQRGEPWRCHRPRDGDERR